MISMGKYESHSITPFVAKVETGPNPVGEAANPFEWKQRHQQLACLYSHLVNKDHTEALMNSIDYLFLLLTTDEGILMTIYK